MRNKISGRTNILRDLVELNVICLTTASFITEGGNGEGGVGGGLGCYLPYAKLQTYQEHIDFCFNYNF